MLKGAVRTDLSTEKEDPGSGELSSPRRGRSPGLARSGVAPRQLCLSQVSPRGGARAAAPAPFPGAALPAPSPGAREPPKLDILCSFSKAPRKLVLLFHYL